MLVVTIREPGLLPWKWEGYGGSFARGLAIDGVGRIFLQHSDPAAALASPVRCGKHPANSHSGGGAVNKEIQKQEIIRLIRSIAASHGGVPPGQTKFSSETGIADHVWRNRIWRNWSDALSEAGFAPLQWKPAHDKDEILQQVSNLSKRMGRFPKSGDLAFERSNNPDFVGLTAIKRRWQMSELAADLKAFAAAHGDHQLVSYCDDFLANTKSRIDDDDDAAVYKPALGYVYLIKYGKDFKVGRTSSMARRSRQVQIELPDETVLVHAILTDDPVGVEAYWHRRFAEKRGNGEWFKLSASDLAAFKKWTKIA